MARAAPRAGPEDDRFYPSPHLSLDAGLPTLSRDEAMDAMGEMDEYYEADS